MMMNAQPGGGMLSQSPYYSYNQPLTPAVPVQSPTTGVTGMADALINGYSQYLQQGQKGGSPMQLSSAAPQNNLGGLIAGLFNGGNAGSATMPDPSMAGVY